MKMKPETRLKLNQFQPRKDNVSKRFVYWRWKNVLVLFVLLMMPVVICSMEHKKEIKINGMNLIEASSSGYREIVSSLINNGAHINDVDRNGWTALIGASCYGHKKIVDSLLNKRAHINAVDHDGWSPLILASRYGRKKIVDSLIKGGTDIKVIDRDGATALMWASCMGYKEIVDSLIKAGADINAADEYGKTSLIMASQNGHEEVVDSLINNGANPYIKDKEGENSLDMAGYKELKRYIVKKYKEYLMYGKSRNEIIEYPGRFIHNVSDSEWKRMRWTESTLPVLQELVDYDKGLVNEARNTS